MSSGCRSSIDLSPDPAVDAAADLDDLFAEEVIARPYAHFARLRERDPVHWNKKFGLWVVTGYEPIVWILRHHELFSSAVIRGVESAPYPPVLPEDAHLFDEVKAFRADQLVEQDRPAHLEQRKTVHAYFTPTAMEAWRPFVRQTVDDLLEELWPRGRMNVVTDLAAPLPVRVIARMMGVPREDMDTLRGLADSILHLNRGEPDRLRPLTAGIRGIVEYVRPFVRERIAEPGDDLISALARGETDGVFTRHQVLVNTGLMLFAGHETTMNLICNGLRAFMAHPEQWDRLRADPDGLARQATEECLRYDPPVKSTQRIVAQEAECCGKTLSPGERIRWIIAAANRDPSVFEDPDRFDIGRQPNPHLSFGSGIHYCLGVALARIEGQEVFRGLARRFERFELETEALRYQPSLQFRSIESMPVTW